MLLSASMGSVGGSVYDFVLIIEFIIEICCLRFPRMGNRGCSNDSTGCSKEIEA